MASDALVPTGQALAEEGLANVDCDESGVPEAYVVASSLQLASRSDAPEDDGSGKKLRTTGELETKVDNIVISWNDFLAFYTM